MANKAQKVIVRIGMSQEIPALAIGEMGWDIDYHRLRVGDGSSIPTMVKTTKSVGAFEYNFIDYVQYPEIRMLPDGTVDGVDISDLNAANGFVVRRGNNLWAHRSIVNTDTYITITNPAGTAGNPTINLSLEIVGRIFDSLTEVAVDDITIHGDGTEAAPLYAHQASYTERGVVELATGQEVIDGITGSRAITPESLVARTSTFTRTGLIRKATLAEVNAGVSTDTVVVPAYLHDYVGDYVENYVENYFETNISNYLRASRIFTVSTVGEQDNREYDGYDFVKEEITWPRFFELEMMAANIGDNAGMSSSFWRCNGEYVLDISRGSDGISRIRAKFTVLNNRLYRFDRSSEANFGGAGATYYTNHDENDRFYPLVTLDAADPIVRFRSSGIVTAPMPIRQRNYLE